MKIDRQAAPASWFVELTRVRDGPMGSAAGRVVASADKPEGYEPSTDYRFSRHAAALSHAADPKREVSAPPGTRMCVCRMEGAR
jgi:hypothetical protein